MWRYIRYLLLKSLQNLDLKITRLGKEYFELSVPSKGIAINFMVSKNIKTKDNEVLIALVNTLKKDVKDKLFHNDKKISTKKNQILINKIPRKFF